jgi:hypothetical protein
MNKAWVGVDAGKEFHWAHVLDASGRQLLSQKIENDEADILELIEEALSSAEKVVWAVDQPGGSAALLLGLLWERNQRVLYVAGLSVDRALATPTALSPKPTPAMLASSPIKLRSERISESSRQVSKRSPNCSSCSLAAATSSPIKAGPSLV